MTFTSDKFLFTNGTQWNTEQKYKDSNYLSQKHTFSHVSYLASEEVTHAEIYLNKKNYKHKVQFCPSSFAYYCQCVCRREMVGKCFKIKFLSRSCLQYDSFAAKPVNVVESSALVYHADTHVTSLHNLIAITVLNNMLQI